MTNEREGSALFNMPEGTTRLKRWSRFYGVSVRVWAVRTESTPSTILLRLHYTRVPDKNGRFVVIEEPL